MRKFVKNYCESCAIYKWSKSQRHKSYSELSSLPVPEFKWVNLTKNFIISLPSSPDWTSTKFNLILVVVDCLTKMVHYISVLKTMTAKALVKVLIWEIVKFHDLPSSIVMDQSLLFTFLFYSSFCYVLKIKQKLSTAFHPQINGQTECQNSIMK